MKRLTALLAFISLLAAPAAAPTSAQDFSESVREFIAVDDAAVALENVTVIDGTGTAPRAGQTVVIENGRISVVGASGSVTVPSGARRMDLAGHTVIPGLVGLHNHTFYTTSARRIQLDQTAPMLYLASGVTTIRTTGSYAPYSEIELKHAIDSGRRAGPHMFITGPYLTGASDNYTYMTRVSGPEDAARVVNYWSEEGVDWFKVYTLISRDELAAVVEAAHNHGKKVTGHICSVSFTEAVELGIDNIEHGFFTNTDYDPDKQADACPSGFRNHLAGMDMDSPEIQETFDAMIAAGVGMTSTLAVYEMSVPNRPPLERRVLDAMSPETRQEYLETRSRIAEQDSDMWKTLFPKAQAFEKAFVDAGGLLASGVDPTGHGGALPGYGDQRNFELLLEAGFDLPTVVRIMSRNGAEILGILDERGTVEAGKAADLVLIDGDLSEDPESIRNVTIVFKDGIGFDSPAMIEAVEGRVGVN